MKKLIALLLCFVCLFSCLGITSSAASVFDEVLTNITINMGMEPDEPIIFGITYDPNERLTGVSVMYKPSPTFSFTRPGTYTVTDDIPLAVDYQFVCWEDEDTGKYYYAGDKIYIDGNKTLYAVWEEKTDGKIRFVRVFTTAIEALRRTLQSFFGFYKTMFEADPNPPVVKDVTFDISKLVTEKHDYYANKRTYQIAVEHYEDNIKYASFSENDKIYLGGRFENVAVDVKKLDENGQVVLDAFGNPVYEKVIKKQLIGATQYSAYYRMTEEIYVDENTGSKYQIIEVTLTDGVPDPVEGMYITFVIPNGMLKHFTSEKEYMTNDTYAFAMLTTKTM
ncbi:MAG: hypothetical protein J6V06_05900 [Clostridia bacterium]|nr:hypothetical protein [Clostridia bacterium]